MTTLLDRLQAGLLSAKGHGRPLRAESYRALKSAALCAALRGPTNDAEARDAALAVRAHLVRLLGLYALRGEAGDAPADRLVNDLDVLDSVEPAGRDPGAEAAADLLARLALEADLRNEAGRRRLLRQAASQRGLPRERLARMVRALAG